MKLIDTEIESKFTSENSHIVMTNAMVKVKSALRSLQIALKREDMIMEINVDKHASIVRSQKTQRHAMIFVMPPLSL